MHLRMRLHNGPHACSTGHPKLMGAKNADETIRVNVAARGAATHGRESRDIARRRTQDARAGR